MYKCKKCQSSEYTKAGFVKGEQRSSVKSVDVNLSRQDRKEEVKKKN